MKSIFINSERRLRNGWKVLGSVALSVALILGLVLLQKQLPVELRRIVSGPLCAFFGVLLSSWLCLRLEREPLSSLGILPVRRSARDFGLGILGGAALVGAVAAVVFSLDGFHLERAASNGAAAIFKVSWFMLGVALFEETLFHGYAFQRAIRGMGPMWTQLVFAAVFSLAHAFNPGMDGGARTVALTATFLAGWMLGLCYLRTGGLALPVGVHVGWNGLLGLLGFGVSGEEFKGMWMPVFHGQPEWLTGGRYGLEASVVTLVVLCLFILALSRWKGTRQSEAPTPLTGPQGQGA
ncbi:CPBP family intramembrane metalloprotease [Myxococcus sp. CA051A]|uniref:CPBP family intramembrane glutamic endopeptidase n=1 Tax=Myxococcus sp. CA051A TaxID=2741739 RepID=UPI00157A3EB6|nr:CPBP family intramembrane glutamic endopeptidase [Myxococcus sp. CA051A]NTX65305.1 CPBP family intramembrane metalloprotease [Myxococcus sp. CA051A]